MTIYYSATTNAFYDSQVYNVNNIPEDKVAVAESTYKNLMAQQCAGRVIVAAADGTPTTIVQTCGPCTSTKYATKTELTNGLAAKANDSNVVHKTGDEHINGVKSFGSVIKATNGTVQVGADTGYSVTFNHNGNITSKQARGTYNIFFPEGSGTLALTSDIDGKANDNNVVHKTGDETIDGNKFFTQDVNVKNSDVDIAVTPSNNLFSCFRFRGKDNVTTASIQYSQRTYGVNDICFYVFDASSNSHGFRIRTDNRLEPLENNTYSLGSSSSKWADVYSTNAHITNTYTNRVTTYSITHHNDTSYFYMSGGSAHDKGATLYLGGVSATNFTPGSFSLMARKTDGSSVELAGSPNGSLTWGGKKLITTEFVKGTNYWYRKHSDGFIEMGGFTNCADKTGSAVATNLPLAFSNTNYTLLVQLTRGRASGDRWGDSYMLPFTQGKTTTGFVVYSNHLSETGSNGGGYDWYACGY